MARESIKYEYVIRRINSGRNEMNIINEMAEKGYRLVAVSPYDGGNSFYFERPYKNE